MIRWATVFASGALEVMLAIPPPTVPAPPAPPEPAIVWNAPASCPSAADFLGRVRELVGPLLPLGAVEVTIEGGGPGGTHVLDLKVHPPASGPSSTFSRQLSHAECEPLVDAAALVLAVSLDPLGTSHRLQAHAPPAGAAGTAVPPPRPAGAPEPTAAADPDADEPGRPRSRARAGPARGPAPAQRPDPPGHAIRAAGGLALGALPGAGGGPELAYALVGPRWRVEALGQYWPNREVTYAQNPEVGARLHLGLARLQGCVTPAVPSVTFPFCAGLELGAIRATGFGTDDRRAVNKLWSAVAAGMGPAVRVARPLNLLLRVEGVVPFQRHAFHIEGLPVLHRVGPVGLRVVLGLEFLLG